MPRVQHRYSSANQAGRERFRQQATADFGWLEGHHHEAETVQQHASGSGRSVERYSTDECLITVRHLNKALQARQPGTIWDYEAASAARQTWPIKKAAARISSQVS